MSSRFVLTCALAAVAMSCDGADTTAPSSFQITIVSPQFQTATVGTAVAAPPSVKLVDQSGRGVEGKTVTFTIESGGGSGTGLTQVTSREGVATVGSWILGPLPGPNRMSVTADVPGLAEIAIAFQATGLAAATQRVH